MTKFTETIIEILHRQSMTDGFQIHQTEELLFLDFDKEIEIEEIEIEEITNNSQNYLSIEINYYTKDILISRRKRESVIDSIIIKLHEKENIKIISYFTDGNLTDDMNILFTSNLSDPNSLNQLNDYFMKLLCD